MRNSWKRVAAGALSLTMVAGAMPANVGGLLTGGKVLVASAEGDVLTDTIQLYYDSDNEANNNTSRTYHGTYADVSGEYVYQVFNGGYAIIKGLCVYSDDEVTITANDALPANYVIQNVTFNVRSGSANVNASTAVVSSGTVTEYGQTLKIENVYSNTLTLRNQGKRSYEVDSVSITYAEKPDLATTTVTAMSSTYTGSALTPVISVDGSMRTAGTDYTYEVYDTATPSVTDVPIGDPTNAGTYYVKVTGIGGYTGTKIVQWNVSQATLTLDNLVAGGERVNGVPSQLTYTGEEQAVKLYYKKNDNTYVPLTAGTDYDVTPYEGAFYLYGDEQRLIASNATNVGNYSAVIVPKGNYKDDSTSDIYAFWSIAKANLAADTNYTAPTGSDDLKYKAADIPLLEDGNTGSVAVDSNTSEPVGTMQYAATRYRAVSSKNLKISSIDDVNVGDIYSPISGGFGIRFPKGCTLTIGNATYNDSNAFFSDEGVAFCQQLPKNGGTYYIYKGNTLSGSGIRITAVDKETKAITAEVVDYNTAYNELVNALNWSTDVPQGTDLGNWYVWYKVEGDANHNSTKPAYVTSKIDYKKSTLTLADSLGAFKVTEVANGTETEVTGNNGVYTLLATKTYKIYTENIVSTDEKSKYRLTEGYHDKANEDDVFEYEYTLKLAVDPAFEAYNLSHLSNWTGKVYSSDPTKLYIADGEVTEGTRKLAATLKANSTYYYGDIIDASSVKIEDAYKDLIKVKNVYFSDSSGAEVDINNAKYGTYSLRAEIVVDNNANKKFDDDGVDLTYTVYKDVEYKARPMDKNNYFVETPDGKLPLTVANGTVTVPEKYYVYSGMIDGNPDDKLVVTEKREALSVMFNRCEEKQTFTYNGTEQKPTIIVKNGGNKADVVASIPATDTAAAAKDYIDGVKAETNAGDYSYMLTAETGTTEAPANYSGAVTVKWTIAQADIQQYISVAPKNNVDTDEVVGNDAIVYDGAVLDGTDFEVKTNEAYAALTDSDADKATKALVDEYLDQLKATPATDTTEAVPAKTVVAAEAANAGEYPKSESPYPKENTFLVTPKEENDKNTYLFQYLIKSDNTHAAADDIIIMPKVNDNDESVEFKVYDSSEGYAEIYVYSDGKIGYSNPYMSDSQETSGPTFVDATLPNTTEYGWYIEQTGTRVLNQGTDNQKTVNVYTISAKKYPTGDLKNAGEHKAKVTVTNSNFKDITQDVNTTIAKRNVTLTPDEDLSMTYRDTEMPDLTYTIEDAKADGLTGVVAADKALFQKTIGEGNDAVTKNAGAIYVDALVQAEANAQAVAFKYAKTGEGNDVATDYTTALLNNAGSYTYAAFDFDNYVVVFPEDDAPTFTVDPLDLKDFDGLKIVLNGKDNDWTTLGNSGFYTYDGKTKAVEVASVGDKVKDTVEFSADNSFTSGYSAEKSFENNGVNLVSNRGYAAGDGLGYACFAIMGDNTLTVTVPEGKTIDRIHFTYKYIYQTDFNNPNNATIKNYADEKIISVKNVNSNTFTLSLSGGQLAVTNVSVDYSSGIDLTAGTDYTVGGMTKSATVGEKTVQVKGKGNYTGVAKATWNTVAAEAGGAELTFTGMTAGQENDGFDFTKTYDGKEVTPKVIFGELDSYYALDADVDIKYYDISSIDGGLNGINTDDLDEVDAPVNAGRYVAVATITCEGYETQILSKVLNIEKAYLTVEASAKNKTMNYGEELPAVTAEDIAAINGLTAADRAFYEQLLADGKLKFYAPANNILVPTVNGELTEDENATVQNFTKNYNLNELSWNLATKAKSIKSDDVTVEFTNGNTVVLDENGFVSESSIIVKDTGIRNDDGKPTVLIAGTDYELNIESTATEGKYIVEVVGKGNYRAIRKVMFTAVTIKPTAETTVEDAANSKLRLTVNAGTEDSSLVAKTGVIFYRGTNCPAELTIESAAANNDIYDFSAEGTAFTGTVKDSKGGVHYVGYIVLTNGTVKYTDVISTTINDEILNANKPTANTTIEDAANSKLRLTVNTETVDSSLVAKTGVIFYRGTNCPAELTIESAAANNDIYDFSAEGTSFSGTVKDSKGGVHYVGYTVLTNGTVKYTDVISTTINDEIWNAVELTANTTVEDAANSKLRLMVNAETEDSSLVTKTGVIFYRGTNCPEELTIESAAANNDIYDFSLEGTSFTGTVKDSKGGVHYVGYTVLVNGTVKYTDSISTKISDFVD